MLKTNYCNTITSILYIYKNFSSNQSWDFQSNNIMENYSQKV